MNWVKLNLIVGVFGVFLAAPVSADTIQVFLQGGQSNCVGNASDTGLPAELQSPQTDILFYFGESPTQGGIDLVDYDLQWLDLQPGSGYDFGPEILFGRTMADALSTAGNQIAIIKYGHGGTGFVTTDSNVWHAGGDATTTGDGNVYQAFQATVTSGIASLQAANPSDMIEIVGMIWIQGERDAQVEPGDYEANLTAFFADIRLTYGANLPIVLAQLSDNQTALNVTNLNIVKTAQANVAAADSNIEMVVTDGYGVNGDNIHFNPIAQIAMGTTMANEMFTLLGVPYCANRPAEDISGPNDQQDCRVDFYDFAVLASDWLESGTGGGELPSPGTVLVESTAPTNDIIVSGGIGGPNYTKIFDPDANANHGRGNMFFTPGSAGADWTMTSLVIRKNTTQAFNNDTLSLWVFEGTVAQWDLGDGDSDGDMFDETGITNILVNGETFTINGSMSADQYVTLNLASAITLDENISYGFMLKYDQGASSNTYFQLYQYNVGDAATDGAQLQAVATYNNSPDTPLTYYVLGFSDCLVPPAADISGPTGQPDCEVDIYDLEALAAGWLECGIEPVELCGQ